MDLAQKASRAKRDLQAAVSKPEATSLRHAVESFDAFVDAVVQEIAALKKGAAPKTEPAETFEPEDARAERTTAEEQAL
jgi:hypothetical protein